MPLIRYRSTDITSLIDEPCPCGLFAKRIAKIAGRCDEMVVCGMGNISPWVFSEILRDIPLATDEWQVRIWHEEYRDVVEFAVEISNQSDGRKTKAITESIQRNLRVRFPDYWKNLEMNLYDFRINPVERDSLRTARKLRRLIVLAEAPPGADEELIHSTDVVSV